MPYACMQVEDESRYLKISGANSEFQKLVGREEKELLGSSFVQLFPEIDTDLEKNILSTRENKNSFSFEYYFFRIGKWFEAKVYLNKENVLLVFFWDITEKKESERKLVQLSTAIEQSPATVVITNTDGNIEYVNPKFSELTGYSREEAIGKNPRILKSGHQSLEFYQNMWNTISSGKSWRGELHNRAKDGSLYWEEARISPVFDKNGKIINYLAVKENITEKKEFIERIQESEEKYRIVADNTFHWEFWENRDGTLLYNSPSCRKVTGYSVEEFEKDPKLMERIIHPDDLYHCNQHREKTWMEYSPDACQFRLITKSGEMKEIEHVCQPAFDRNGVFCGIRGTNIDITDKRKLKRQLVDSDLYHRSLLQTLPDIIFVLSKEGEFLDVKVADNQLLSYPPDAFLGKNIKDIMEPEVVTQQLNAIRNCFISQKVETFEYSLDIKNKTGYFSAHTIAFGEDRVIVTIRDITEYQKNLTQVKSLLAKEERMNSSLRSFAEIVSHNLRIHTANMLGILKIWEMEDRDTFNNPYLQMIQKSSNKLEETITHLNEILQLSKERNFLPETIALRELVEDIIRDLSSTNSEKNIRFINEIGSDVKIRTVQGYLKSILNNLISNSIRFHSPNRDSYVSITVEQPNELSTIIQVEDNGLGFDSERHGSKLFGMYKTFHEGFETKGLGLFFVKKKLDALGGDIEAHSEEGKGSIFRIMIPSMSSD